LYPRPRPGSSPQQTDNSLFASFSSEKEGLTGKKNGPPQKRRAAFS
jgi:hypothetical protein